MQVVAFYDERGTRGIAFSLNCTYLAIHADSNSICRSHSSPSTISLQRHASLISWKMSPHCSSLPRVMMSQSCVTAER
jgi:hypothetical protein